MSPLLQVNGRPAEIEASVAALVERLGPRTDGKGVAVALNGVVVPRSRWPETALAPGDEVEIIRAMSGG